MIILHQSCFMFLIIYFIGVVNIGRMKIAGLDFESESENELLQQDM